MRKLPIFTFTNKMVYYYYHYYYYYYLNFYCPSDYNNNNNKKCYTEKELFSLADKLNPPAVLPIR
jgi:hypothetical protein